MAVHAGEPDDRLMDAVVRLSFEVVASLTQVGSAHGLSLTQLRLLGILRDREPTMAELAEHLGLDRSTVSGLVDRAARRGLVRRIASDVDRRSSRVGLTRSGLQVATRLESEMAARLSPATTALSPREQDTLVRLLGLTRRSLRG